MWRWEEWVIMGWSHQLESNCCPLQLSELSSPNVLTHHPAKFSESFEFRKGSWMFWIRKREARWVLRRKKERNWFRNCFFDSKINFLLPQFLYSVEADRHLQKTSERVKPFDSNGLTPTVWGNRTGLGSVWCDTHVIRLPRLAAVRTLDRVRTKRLNCR